LSHKLFDRERVSVRSGRGATDPAPQKFFEPEQRARPRKTKNRPQATPETARSYLQATAALNVTDTKQKGPPSLARA